MMNINFINIIFIITVIYLIYMIYDEYMYHNHNKDNYILSLSDFENNLDKYKDSNLFNNYTNLSYSDKIFVNDFINYTVLKHKLDKPRFKKRISRIKENVILPAITSNIGSFTMLGIIMSLKQNLTQHIASNLI